MPSDLFQWGDFALHSKASNFKLECEALTDAEWACLAKLAVRCVLPFGDVQGVPRGGEPLAYHLMQYRQQGAGLLIVDDVLTSGDSMEKFRSGRTAQGLVVFARGPLLPWVSCVFSANRLIEEI